MAARESAWEARSLSLVAASDSVDAKHVHDLASGFTLVDRTQYFFSQIL